jgi:hypothetical protein
MSIRADLDRLWASAVGAGLALLVAACGFTVLGQPPPIPVGPVGPVVPNPNGGAPVECRSIPIEECTSFAGVDGQPNVVREIVTCTKVCTPSEGEYRVDLLMADGRIEQAGSGAYATAPAAAPGEPEPAPAPS